MPIRQATFETEFVKHIRYRYLLSMPTDYSQNEVWPLILFLHGYDERGDDPKILKGYGIPKIASQMKRFPFITASPQCPLATTWMTQNDALMRFLEMLISRYHVDQTRIYLTGLSMGGYAVWDLAAEFPEVFAAIAPVCGGGSWLTGFPEKISALRDMPVWAFHGAMDDEVPVTESETLVQHLRDIGADDVRLTVYPNVGHESWIQAYNEPALYQWFLRHTSRRMKP